MGLIPEPELTGSLFQHQGQSYRAVIGVDEVGRGALFGPVTVGATLVTRDNWDSLTAQPWFASVTDSKLLSGKKRGELQPVLAAALPHAVSHTAVRYIDAYNINRAVQRGIYKTVQRLVGQSGIDVSEIRVLFDGKHLPQFPQVGMSRPMPRLWAEVKADQKYFPVSAASILAKVARDAMITRAAQRFEGYGLDQHAGYGTAVHRAAITERGRTKFHRKSFSFKKNNRP
jgi:ribonuclease HII